MNKNTFLYLCLTVTVAILFTQCKKDDSSPDPTPTPVKDYMPVTAGSTFTYQNTAGTNVTTYTLTVSGKDTVLNAKTYKIFTSTDSVNRYRAKVSSDYFQLASIPMISIANFENLYLKENAAINDTWADNVQVPNPTNPAQTFTATLTNKMMEKGISYTVNGKLYENTIHVKLSLSIKVPITGVPFPITVDLGGGDMYYALGVGMIKNSLNISSSNPLLTFPPINSEDVLLSYVIK